MLKVSIASFNPVQGDAAVGMQRWADNKMGLVGIDGANKGLYIDSSGTSFRMVLDEGAVFDRMASARVVDHTAVCLGVKGPCLFLQIGHEGVNVWR